MKLLKLAFVLGLLSLSVALQVASGGHIARQHDAMETLFQELDDNGDGQIEECEAQKYIDTALGGPEMASFDRINAAKLIAGLDGVDTDATVSVLELERSLALRLRVGFFIFSSVILPYKRCRVQIKNPGNQRWVHMS